MFNALDMVLCPDPSETLTATAYVAPKVWGTNDGSTTFAAGVNDSGAGAPFRCRVYRYDSVGLAKHADVADVATFTVSPAKMVVPGAVPLICTTVGGFTVGAAQVALTVVFAVPFCPLPDTTTAMA